MLFEVSGSIGTLRSHRYGALLALLVLLIAVQSFDGGTSADAVASDALRSALGVAILFFVFERKLERLGMAGLMAVILCLGWARYVSVAASGHGFTIALHVAMSVYLWIAVFVILRDLFRRTPTGVENVLGAICGYLISGIAWGDLNALAFVVVPSAYSINPEIRALFDTLQSRVALFSYYGFSQMLTIGYADVTPVRAPATTLSMFSTLFGLFYTAIVVSQFVGLTQSVARATGRKP